MINENTALEIANQTLSIIRKENKFYKDNFIIGNSYYPDNGWIIFHHYHSEPESQMGGISPGNIAIDEVSGEIVDLNSDHFLAKIIQKWDENERMRNKNGYF